LARLRQVAIALMAVEICAVLIEKTTGRDPVPDWIDVSLCLVAFGALLFITAAEALASTFRHTLAADAEDLATRRRHEEDERSTAQRRRERIENILAGEAFPAMVFQPIVDLRTGRTVGFEALSRFDTGPPDVCFADAAHVGLGLQLELKAIRRALRHLDQLPEDAYLSVNCSPTTLLSDDLYDILARHDTARIVVELTEQMPVEDYHQCRTAIDRLRRAGARLAIDDLGAGYASLRHVIALKPEIIKLDRGLADVADPSTQMMVQTLVTLGRLIGATILAEGIEDAAGIELVRALGVELGQGWHLGMPQPITEIIESRTAATVPQPPSPAGHA
jgi:EAL domain-containing protein (putative c-di-GMP-specific phosphodiesterase class I)